MGLGKLFTRNITYDVTNTQTGAKATYTLVTDGGPGMYPGWGDGVYRGGMAIPAAWRLSMLIANQIGRVPFQAFREAAGRPPVRIVPTPPLLARPAGGMDTSLGTFRSWALDRVWHGNAIGVVVEWSPLGWPTACTPVSAEFVQMKIVQPNDPVVAPGFTVGEIAYLINGKWYHQRDVIHFRGPTKPGELRGMGILECHFDAMERSRKLDASASAVDSGAVPTGVLKSLDPDLSAQGAADLKVAWQNSQRTRSVAVLNPLTDFQPIAWNPTETQLLEARKYTLTEWGNIFGVDPGYAGGESASGTYSNIETRGFELLKFGTVGDIIAEFEATLTEKLPRGNYVKANLDHLLRAETKARYEAHAIAISSGFLTRDEVRELEERPPLTEEQKKELQEMAAPAPKANNTQGTGEAAPRKQAENVPIGGRRSDAEGVRIWLEAREQAHLDVVRALVVLGADADVIADVMDELEERGYPEFNQHQPRWPKGTGDKAGEWTDAVGGRVPFGAKNPFVGKKTNTKRKWNVLEGGAPISSTSDGRPKKISYVKPPKTAPAGGSEFGQAPPLGKPPAFVTGQKPPGGSSSKPGTQEYEDQYAYLLAGTKAAKPKAAPAGGSEFGQAPPLGKPPAFVTGQKPKAAPAGGSEFGQAPPLGKPPAFVTGQKPPSNQEIIDKLAEVAQGANINPKNVAFLNSLLSPGVKPVEPKPKGVSLKPGGGLSQPGGSEFGQAPPLGAEPDWASAGGGLGGSANEQAVKSAKVKLLAGGFKEGHLDGKLKPKSYAEAEKMADLLGTDPPWESQSKKWTAAQWGAYWTEVAKDPGDPGYAMDEAQKVGQMAAESKKLAAQNAAPTAPTKWADMNADQQAAYMAEAMAELKGGDSGFGTGPKLGDSKPLGQKQKITPTIYGDNPASFANQLARRYAEQVRAIPKEQATAAARYFGSGYTPMNMHLWGVKPLSPDSPQYQDIGHLNELMKAWEAPQTLRLARGLDPEPNMPPYPAPKGTVYASKGFQSTTVGDKPAFSQKQVIMNITFPKGSNGVVANGTGLSPFDNEQEVLLPHGTRYLIESDKIGPDGKRYMNVTVLPWEG
jgi:HK97 family phage portal protein